MKLDNGDVIPSFLVPASTPLFSSGSHFGNLSLVRGEVIKVIYPDDDESVSRKFLEYNVYFENRRNGTGNGEQINNVCIWNPLASAIDYETQVLRASDKVPWNEYPPISNGSKVLMLFINGEASRAVIIGGIRDVDDKKDPGDLSSDAGRYKYSIFNGLAMLVDDNGAFSITFNGPTKSDGSLDTNKVDKSATKSSFFIDKDGSLNLSTNNGQNQLIDNKNNKINHLAKDEYHIKVSNGKVTTDSTGVELGKATDAMMMGTTYRQAEQQLHTKLTSNLTILQTLMATAASQITAAGTALTAVGGSPLLAAGAAMTAMIAQIANMISAINSFEAQNKSYLSSKNKLD